MGSLRALLAHPVTVVVAAVVVGVTLHRLTSTKTTDDSARRGHESPVLISRTLPVESDPAPTPQQTLPDPDPVETTAAVATAPPSIAHLSSVQFSEIWGYLMAGEHAKWSRSAPITDVCLFNFKLDDTGKIVGKLSEETVKLARQRRARSHIVIASSGQKTLMHFLLNPNYRAQNRFLGEILALVRRHGADGLQLDFESILPGDRWHFISFVKKLRSALPDGMVFSLALPARTTESPDNALRYRGLEELADRYFIMVYDEHWKGGGPGSVASKSWHDRVVRHALHELPAEKIVFGLPFYGRIWQREKLARATRYPQLAAIVAGNQAIVQYDLEKSHHFTFEQTVTAECWFDDAVTLHAKFAAARKQGARAVGFWRLGQEDPRVWQLLTR